jgi:Isocitrate/isopropylmalate dehydrogenase
MLQHLWLKHRFTNQFTDLSSSSRKNIANPLATILSAAMMFEDTFNLKREADLIRNVVNSSLKQSIISEDLANGNKSYKTSEIGDWLVKEIL